MSRHTPPRSSSGRDLTLLITIVLDLSLSKVFLYPAVETFKVKKVTPVWVFVLSALKTLY